MLHWIVSIPDAFTAHETYETKNCNLFCSLPWDSISNNSCVAHISCNKCVEMFVSFSPSFLCVFYLHHITWSTWRCEHFVQYVYAAHWKIFIRFEHWRAYRLPQMGICNIIILSTHNLIILYVNWTLFWLAFGWFTR